MLTQTRSDAFACKAATRELGASDWVATVVLYTKKQLVFSRTLEGMREAWTAIAFGLVILLSITAQSARIPTATESQNLLQGPQGLQVFSYWTGLHNKTYTSQEELQYRLSVFQQNVERINVHNAGGATHKLAVNAFADLTPEEFRSTHLGLRPGSNSSFRSRAPGPFSHADTTAPDAIDWVKEGAVTPVKNQLFCGSCWAFSTTGSVEGANYLQTGQLTTLSEQQLVDCDTSKDMGCGGGLMDYAFEYIKKNGGIDTETDYPYWSVGTFCNALRQDRHVVTIDGYEDVPENDESALQQAVGVQPVSVAICASDLQFYSSGVVSECCKDLDHGVLAAGYGEENGKPYWLVKNSWGETWGEAGYFRLARNVETKYGTCGITQAASYPIKTSPNPATVPEVCGWLGLSECAAPTSCNCQFSILGLVCLGWGCA